MESKYGQGRRSKRLSISSQIAPSKTTKPKRRWNILQVYIHRLAVRNSKTKDQLLLNVETPGALDEEDEAAAGVAATAHAMMERIGNPIDRHGNFELKPDLWGEVSEHYPFEISQDREWIRDEKKRRFQQSSNNAPSTTTAADNPITTGSSKRSIQNGQVSGGPSKKPKVSSSTDISYSSGGESSNVKTRPGDLESEPAFVQSGVSKTKTKVNPVALLQSSSSNLLQVQETLKIASDSLQSQIAEIDDLKSRLAKKAKGLEEASRMLREKDEEARKEAKKITSQEAEIIRRFTLSTSLLYTNKVISRAKE